VLHLFASDGRSSLLSLWPLLLQRFAHDLVLFPLFFSLPILSSAQLAKPNSGILSALLTSKLFLDQPFSQVHSWLWRFLVCALHLSPNTSNFPRRLSLVRA
jgi:hypothetical protein